MHCTNWVFIQVKKIWSSPASLVGRNVLWKPGKWVANDVSLIYLKMSGETKWSHEDGGYFNLFLSRTIPIELLYSLYASWLFFFFWTSIFYLFSVWQASLDAREDGIMTAELLEKLFSEEGVVDTGVKIPADQKGDYATIPDEVCFIHQLLLLVNMIVEM